LQDLTPTSLDQVDGLGLRPEARRKLIRENARELFKI
jgi:predicted TIM-barrel fold metal-dependent hydrolase